MAKMSDLVPNERLGTSRVSHIFPKSTRMTPPQNLKNKKLAVIQHSYKVK